MNSDSSRDDDNLRPDLARVKLVDPASYESRPSDEKPVSKVLIDPKKFDLEFNCSEGEHKFGANRFYGTAWTHSDPQENFTWIVACVDEETEACIMGTIFQS